VSIQNIGRNKWRVIVKTDKINPETKRPVYIDKRFRGTRVEAQIFEMKLKGGSSDANVPTSLTVGSYLKDIWLPSLMVSESTMEDYKSGVRYLQPLYGILLWTLGSREIENSIHSLPEGHRRRKARRVLSVALNAAVRWGMISYNPLVKTRIVYGNGETRRYKAYSPDELLEVFKAFRGCPGESVVIIMAYCGLSREEALGLDWEDVNFDTGEIDMHKAWTMVGNKAVLGEPKNKWRERYGYLDGWGLERIKELGEGKSGPLWPGIANERIRPTSAYRAFRRRMEKAGLRVIPINHLRHTHATISLASGVDVAVVSKDLGHAQISTTANAYLRPQEQARKDAAESFAQAMQTKSSENLPKTRGKKG